MMELHIPEADFNPVMGRLEIRDNEFMRGVHKQVRLEDNLRNLSPIFIPESKEERFYKMWNALVDEQNAYLKHSADKAAEEYERAFRKTKSNEQSRAEWGLPPNTPGQMNFAEFSKGIVSSMVPDVGGYEGNQSPQAVKVVYGPSSGYEGPTGYINNANQIILFGNPIAEPPKFTEKQREQARNALSQYLNPQTHKSAANNPQGFVLEKIIKESGRKEQDSPAKHSGWEMILRQLNPKTIKVTYPQDFSDFDYFSNADEDILLDGELQYQVQYRNSTNKHFAGGQSVYIKKGIHECKKDKMIPGREEEFDEHDVSGLEQSDTGELKMVHLLGRDGVQHPHYEDRDQTPVTQVIHLPRNVSPGKIVFTDF